MIRIATNYYYRTFEFFADATEVGVQFCFYRRVYQRAAVLGAEYQVDVVFYK